MQYQLLKDGTAKAFDDAVLVMDDIYAVPERFSNFAPKRSVKGAQTIPLNDLVALVGRKVGSVVRADLTSKDGDEIVSNDQAEIKQQIKNGSNLVALSLLTHTTIPIIITLFASGRVLLPSSIAPDFRTKVLRSVLAEVLDRHQR